MPRKVLLLFCCLLICIAGYSQSSKALRLYDKALLYNKEKKTDKAYNEMGRAIAEDPGFADAYSILGLWYFQAHQFQLAVNVFRDAAKNCKNGNTLFAKPLVRCLLYNMNVDSAEYVIDTYAPTKKDSEWQHMRVQAATIRQATGTAWKDTAFNMGPRINTPDPELYPSITADTQTFYFTRRVGGVNDDFYCAVPDSCGGWFTARNMGRPLNTPDHESAQFISADGHYLFFTRCGNRSENGWDRGDCDLFMAYRTADDSLWSVPQSFGGTINSPAYEGMPCLSADNRELYFVSDRPGGYGGTDIWVSRFEDGVWQRPINLGPSVNTPGNESAPFLAVDNRTLYFTSDGHPGLGGTDLFTCTRINDSNWTTPVNMGYPINTTANEKSLCITTDGQKLYFSSDRDSVEGNYDIYQMHLPKPLQPKPIGYVWGYVYDSISKDRLNYASIFISDAATGDTMYHFQSNRGDASYMAPLPLNHTYIYYTQRIGYTDIADTLQLGAARLDTLNITMLSQDYVKPISDTLVATIHFPLNSATLSDSDKAIINKAMDPWMLEKGITVMINGYTDNTGSPMINEQLSYQRADLVSQQITAMGIDPMMIKSQGWGEAKTIATNDTEEGRMQNRRVEVIIRR
jgi:outer membrane protein OmpA-like peptidoglycan-associated protein